jgi:two-component system OmpR family sensor kinase
VTLQRKPQVLNDLVDEVLAAHQARADAKQIAITHTFPDELIEVTVDRSEILQVFTNLIGNAVAYTPAQGVITIRSHPVKLGDRSGVAVQFHNTGPTIAPADVPHLFERFYRGQTGRDSGEPGTGLGLAICKEIVERHQGRLEVESTEEKGTIFTVWLPLSE